MPGHKHSLNLQHQPVPEPTQMFFILFKQIGSVFAVFQIIAQRPSIRYIWTFQILYQAEGCDKPEYIPMHRFDIRFVIFHDD